MADPWDPRDDCPEVERHTSVPSGYVARAEDAERRLAAGEVQRQCPACGLWAIWDVPSAQALSEATVEQLRAELARRDSGWRPSDPYQRWTGAKPALTEAGRAAGLTWREEVPETAAVPTADWHAALTTAGLVRGWTGWALGRTLQIAEVDGFWRAAGIPGPFASEEGAARAWLAARGGGA